MFVVGKVPLPLMTAEIERERERGGEEEGREGETDYS